MTTPSNPIVRAWLQSGKLKRKIVFTVPPFPKVGDICTILGTDWTVVKTQKDKGFVLEFPQAKAKQVFP